MCFAWSILHYLCLCFLVCHNHPCCIHLLGETSKRAMCCMEYQDAFIRVVYLVADKDERGNALSANMERGADIFLQNCHSLLSIC